MIDRYHRLGLSKNPFCVQALRDAADCFVDRGLPDPPSSGAGTLVQVIGDKGAGKTTQVQAWRRDRPGPYHYVPQSPYVDRWRPPPVAALVYADEIDRMPRPLRLRWFRRLGHIRATLVAGTHRDLSRIARLCGLDVVTHRLEPASLRLTQAVLTERIRSHAIDPSGARLRLSAADIAGLHRRSGGSLRRAESLAHQLVADRAADQPADSASSDPDRLSSHR